MSIKHLINAYEPQTKEAMLSDNLKVVFIEATFNDSFSKAKELLKLLNGALKAKTVKVDSKDTLDMDIDFTAISSNLASGEMKTIEAFIRKNCKLFLQDGGEWHHVLVDEMDFAFNQENGTYIPFLVDGVKFHFAKHLPSGNGLLASLANKAINKMHIENLKPTA